MTLPASGPISLGQVNTTLSRGATNTITMNDSELRTLAGVPSGVISMSSLHGKSWWVSRTNGYPITWAFGASGDVFSAISPTGFRPQTIYWQIQTWNGNTFGFNVTHNLWGRRQSDGVWEVIGQYTYHIPASTLITHTATLGVLGGKENIIYTQLRIPASNRESIVRLATFLER